MIKTLVESVVYTLNCLKNKVYWPSGWARLVAVNKDNRGMLLNFPAGIKMHFQWSNHKWVKTHHCSDFVMTLLIAFKSFSWELQVWPVNTTEWTNQCSTGYERKGKQPNEDKEGSCNFGRHNTSQNLMLIWSHWLPWTVQGTMTVSFINSPS